MYNKYTWQNGEVITAEKLNNMEDGIEGAYEVPAYDSENVGSILFVNGEYDEEEGTYTNPRLDWLPVPELMGNMPMYIIQGYGNGDTIPSDELNLIEGLVGSGIVVLVIYEEGGSATYYYYSTESPTEGLIFRPISTNDSSYYYTISGEGLVTRRGGVN